MNLADKLYEQIANTSDLKQRARLRCQLAKELEESGEYEGACEVMGEFWSGVGGRPHLEGLDEATRANVLLRVGVLTGWIGSVRQMSDVQEQAKNFISESIRTFESLHDAGKVDEAQADLAYCYWRQGALDEARDILREVLDRLADSEGETKMVAVIRAGIVERSAKRYHDALRIQV